MTTTDLPEFHDPIIFSTRLAPDGRKLLAIPLTREEIQADAGIKQWLEKGYVLEGFTNTVSPNDPYTTVVIAHLRRGTDE